MILTLHILLAIMSLVQASYLYARPSGNQFLVAGGLIGTTLGSGVWLTVLSPAHLAPACVSGVIYVAIVGTLLIAGQRKLVQMT